MTKKLNSDCTLPLYISDVNISTVKAIDNKYVILYTVFVASDRKIRACLQENVWPAQCRRGTTVSHRDKEVVRKTMDAHFNVLPFTVIADCTGNNQGDIAVNHDPPKFLSSEEKKAIARHCHLAAAVDRMNHIGNISNTDLAK